jgi:23S rRNA pseudouridine1911/1915/1917 synthase
MDVLTFMINKPITILAETKDYLVVFKNSSVPSSVGKSPNSCFELVAKDFPEVAEIKGKNENDGGLVHRLDTDTAGIILFARNQDFYEKIMEAQSKNQFEKTYTAYCGTTSFLKNTSDLVGKTISSYFRSFGEKGASVKPIFNPETETKANRKKCGNKIYSTKIWSIQDFAENDDKKLLKVKCKIFSGFRHQVRSHLASQNLPVFGDKIYNENCKKSAATSDKMLFFASEISFLGENYSLSEEMLDEIAKSSFFASATK